MKRISSIIFCITTLLLLFSSVLAQDDATLSQPTMYPIGGRTLMIYWNTLPGPYPSAYVDYVAPNLQYKNVEVPFSHSINGTAWWIVPFDLECGETIFFQITISGSVYSQVLKQREYCLFFPNTHKSIK